MNSGLPKRRRKKSILNISNIIYKDIEAHKRFVYSEISCNFNVVQGVNRHEVDLSQIVKILEKSFNTISGKQSRNL